MAIFACEELLSEFETKPPPGSSLEIEGRLKENSTLISLHLDQYSNEIANEIHKFWIKLRSHNGKLAKGRT